MDSGQPALAKPIGIGVVIALLFVGLVFIVGGTDVGLFLLMIHYVHQFSATQMAEQLRSAKGTCMWIKAMNDAGIGARHVTRYGQQSYGVKLAQAIHGLYVHSACPSILSGHYHP